MAIESVGVTVDVDDLELDKLENTLKKLDGSKIKLKLEVDDSQANPKTWVDNWKTASQNITKTIDGISSQMKKVANPLNEVGNKILGTGVAVGGAGLAAGISELRKGMGDFEQIQTDLKLTQTMLKLTEDQYEQLYRTASKLAMDTIFDTTDESKAILELSKAGMNFEQIIGGGLKGVNDLASAAGGDLTNSVDAVVKAMNIFGIDAKDTSKIADALAGAANASVADIGDLAKALGQGGLASKNANQDLNETLGVMAALTDIGKDAGMAGTTLRSFFSAMTNPSGPAADTIEQYGLEFKDLNGNIKGAADLAEEFQKKLGSLSSAERSDVIYSIFGNYGADAAFALMDKGKKGIQEYIDATKELGSAGKLSEAYMNTQAGAVNSLGNSYADLRTAIAKVSEKPFVSMVRNLDDHLEKLQTKILDNPKQFEAFFEKIYGTISKWIDKAFSFDWVGFFNGLKTSLTELKDQIVKDFGFLQKVMGNFTNGADKDANSLGKAFGNLFKVGYNSKKWALELKAGSAVLDTFSGAMKTATGLIDGGSTIWNAFFSDSGKFNKFFGNLKKAKDVIPQAADDVVNGVGSKVGAAGAGIAGAGKGVTDAGGGLNKKLGSINSALLTSGGIAVDVMLWTEALKKLERDMPDNFQGLQKKIGSLALALGEFQLLFTAFGKLEQWSKGAGITGAISSMVEGGAIFVTTEAVANLDKKIPANIGQLVHKATGLAAVLAEMKLVFMGLGALTVGTGGLSLIGAGASMLESGALWSAVKAIDKLNKLEIPDNVSEKVGKVTSTMSQIMEQLPTQDLITSWEQKNTAEAADKVLSHLNGMVDSINSINKNFDPKFNIKEFEAKLAELRKVVDVMKGQIQDTNDALNQGLDQMGIAFKIEQDARVIEAANQKVQAFDQITQTIRTFSDKITTFTKEDLAHLSDAMFDLKQAIKIITGNDVDKQQGVFDALGDALSSWLGSKTVDNQTALLQKLDVKINTFSELGQKLNGLASLKDTIKTNDIATSLKQIKDGMTSIKDNALTETFIDAADEAITGVGTLATSITKIQGIQVNGDAVVTMMGELKKALSAIFTTTYTKQSLDETSDVMTSIASYASTGNFTTLNNLDTLIARVNSIGGKTVDSDAIAAVMTNLSTALGHIFGASFIMPEGGNIVDNVTALGGIVNALEQVITELNKLVATFRPIGVDYATKIVEGFTSVNVPQKFLDEIMKARNTLNGMDNELWNMIGRKFANAILNGFKENLGQLKIAVIEQKNQIQSVLNEIKIPDLSTKLNVDTSALDNIKMPSLDAVVKYRDSQGKVVSASTGGLIGKNGVSYFAKGGLAGIFKPKGIDTVPAMLAQGEYVMNRQAVKNLGVGFMQDVNNSNYSGILDRVSSKLNGAVTASRNVVNNIVNNYNYNNNLNYQYNAQHVSNQDYSMAKIRRGMRNL